MSAASELDDERRPPLPETEAFILGLQHICTKNAAQLEHVGGNILIHILGIGSWTIVTRGQRAGIYEQATDDDVAFVLSCEEWVLHELLEPDLDSDWEEYREEGFLYTQGDPASLMRLIAFAEPKSNVIALRSRTDL